MDSSTKKKPGLKEYLRGHSFTYSQLIKSFEDEGFSDNAVIGLVKDCVFQSHHKPIWLGFQPEENETHCINPNLDFNRLHLARHDENHAIYVPTETIDGALDSKIYLVVIFPAEEKVGINLILQMLVGHAFGETEDARLDIDLGASPKITPKLEGFLFGGQEFKLDDFQKSLGRNINSIWKSGLLPYLHFADGIPVAQEFLDFNNIKYLYISPPSIGFTIGHIDGGIYLNVTAKGRDLVTLDKSYFRLSIRTNTMDELVFLINTIWSKEIAYKRSLGNRLMEAHIKQGGTRDNFIINPKPDASE